MVSVSQNFRMIFQLSHPRMLSPSDQGSRQWQRKTSENSTRATSAKYNGVSARKKLISNEVFFTQKGVRTATHYRVRARYEKSNDHWYYEVKFVSYHPSQSRIRMLRSVCEPHTEQCKWMTSLTRPDFFRHNITLVYASVKFGKRGQIISIESNRNSYIRVQFDKRHTYLTVQPASKISPQSKCWKYVYTHQERLN